jgi:putative DNA primase/helicase
VIGETPADPRQEPNHAQYPPHTRRPPDLVGPLPPHRREDLLTKITPVAYDPEAVCPEWERFLEPVFAGDAALIRFVQRLLGHCLTGDVSEHVLAVFYGAGANGKSTLLNAVLGGLGPDYGMQAAPGLLMARHGDRHPTERADLFGKRVVVASESEQGGRFDEALVKQLTGDDKVKARRMREDFWEFDPSHKLILCTNHRPKVSGTDNSIWRRLRLVPFTTTFWNPDKPAPAGAARPEELRQDKRLPEKLRAEAPGILAWLVHGCLAWQGEGLAMPSAVADATQQYRSEEDLLGEFLAEQCVVGNGLSVRSSDLFARYKSLLEASGEPDGVGQHEFGRAMTARGFGKRKSNGVWYLNVALQPETTKQ